MKKRKSGPSGKNKGTPIMIRVTEDQLERWRVAADRHAVTLSAWIRLACDRQVERKTLG